MSADTGARPEEPVRVGNKLALGVAVLAAGVLAGAAAGPPGLVAGLVAGLAGVGVGAALRALVRDGNRSRALGSVGLAAGGVALLGSVAGLAYAGSLPSGHPLGHSMTDAGDAAIVVLVAAGVLAAAADAFVERPVRATGEVVSTLWRSSHVLVVGAVLTYLAAIGALVDVPLALVSGYASLLAAAGRPTVDGGLLLAANLVVLQLLAVATVWLVRRSVPVLDGWVASATGGREEPDVAGLLRVLPDPTGLPASVWGLIGVQLLVVVFAGRAVGALVTQVLDVLGVLGTVARAAVGAGVFHWPLVAVGALAGVVLVADWLRGAVVFWAGRNPPTSLAFAAGGVAGVAVGAVAGVATMTAEVALGARAGGRLVAPGVTVAVGAGMFVTAVLAVVPERAARLFGVRRATGFAGGAAALFVAGLGVALFGVGGQAVTTAETLVPLAAIVGVAASVLVWDLGENAVALRDQLGRETDTSEVELTHGVASVLVAGGGAVLAAAAYYLAGPLLFTSVDIGPVELSDGLVDIGPERALVALGLALVALLAFGVLVDRGQDPGPK